jgi:threonine synthase
LLGVIKKAKAGYFMGGETIVCVLTGHGIKDPDRAIAIAPQIIKKPGSLLSGFRLQCQVILLVIRINQLF